jgi:serine/threonine protein kinase
MSVPTSVEELIQLIRKSGMVDENKLSMYLHRRQTGRGISKDPREVADAMVTDGLITQFQSEQFLLGKWRGFTVGKYKLLERIGVGGMGQVFLCEHLFMKRRVAVKVLPPAKAEQPAALGRFYREARAAGSIEHPNIVRTHDIDQDGNLHFIVMEYVDGTNLLDIVKKFGPMDIRRATHYIRQIAIGLDFAFKSGIIHRDIKPGNILIDRQGTAKLLDMGLARFYQDQTDMLTIKYDDKIVLGTADYVAPEQVANSHAVDVRADVYALGASLYFLLAGHPPFPTGTVSQKLLWHRTKDPTPIRQIRPEVPEGLAAIIAKMMQKDPNARYNTPGEVAAELERWVPAQIPSPAPEEMPVLCPAAMDSGVSESSKGGSRGSVKESATSIGTAKPSPFAPTHQADTPEPQPKYLPDSPLTTTNGSKLAAGAAVVSRSKLPAAPSPFTAMQETPNPASAFLATPSPGLPAGTPFSQPVPFPVVTGAMLNKPTSNHKGLLVLLVGVALFLGLGFVVYKFAWSKPAAPPLQQVEEG